MNKLVFVLFSLFIIMSLGDIMVTNAYQPTPVVEGKPVITVCGDHVCRVGESPIFEKFYIQWQFYKLTHQGKLGAVETPQSIDIIAPDGSCNITGITESGGTCTTPSMVVSAADFASLQTDPFVGAVININPSQAQPTTSFCQIANWIILNEDGYSSNNTAINNLIDPPYCNGPVVIPEFPVPALVGLGAFTISIILGSLLIRKFELWR